MKAPAAPTPNVVVFDLDDTLYLERDYVRSGFQSVGAWAEQVLGLRDLGDRAWAAFEGGVRGSIFDVALASAGIDVTPGLIAQLVACYRNHVPDIVLLPDARACLDLLGLESDVIVAVITDGPLASQKAKTAALGLNAWSQHIIFTEALGAGFGKPHTRAFELVQQRVGVGGDRCVYIADNPVKDFAAPRELGWTTIRVRRQHGLHVAVESGRDIDHEVADLAILPALLGVGGPDLRQVTG